MPRLFTLDEANSFIQVLQRDLGRLRELRNDSRPTRDALTRVEQKGKSNGKDLAIEIHELQEKLEAWRAEADAILATIVDIGCEIKDIEQGLVDFPSERQGRTVYLCWKLGEDRIEYWHELSAGFGGRQPL